MFAENKHNLWAIVEVLYEASGIKKEFNKKVADFIEKDSLATTANLVELFQILEQEQKSIIKSLNKNPHLNEKNENTDIFVRKIVKTANHHSLLNLSQYAADNGFALTAHEMNVVSDQVAKLSDDLSKSPVVWTFYNNYEMPLETKVNLLINIIALASNSIGIPETELVLFRESAEESEQRTGLWNQAVLARVFHHNNDKFYLNIHEDAIENVPPIEAIAIVVHGLKRLQHQKSLNREQVSDFEKAAALSSKWSLDISEIGEYEYQHTLHEEEIGYYAHNIRYCLPDMLKEEWDALSHLKWFYEMAGIEQMFNIAVDNIIQNKEFPITNKHIVELYKLLEFESLMIANSPEALKVSQDIGENDTNAFAYNTARMVSEEGHRKLTKYLYEIGGVSLSDEEQTKVMSDVKRVSGLLADSGEVNDFLENYSDMSYGEQKDSLRKTVEYASECFELPKVSVREFKHDLEEGTLYKRTEDGNYYINLCPEVLEGIPEDKVLSIILYKMKMLQQVKNIEKLSKGEPLSNFDKASALGRKWNPESIKDISPEEEQHAIHESDALFTTKLIIAHLEANPILPAKEQKVYANRASFKDPS